MSTIYRPTEPIGFTLEQADWLRREMRAIKDAGEAAKPYERLQILHAAPERVFAGMVIYADGSDYNPGAGAGVYRRSEDNTTWVHLG